jgi:EAL and modified HD-GYP domain-containing signal transduction protein
MLAARAGDLFLVGLLSMVDALLRRPAREVLGALPIAQDITLAVLEGTGALGEVLRAVREWEHGHFDEAEGVLVRAGVEVGDFAEQYAEAIAWAEALPV